MHNSVDVIDQEPLLAQSEEQGNLANPQPLTEQQNRRGSANIMLACLNCIGNSVGRVCAAIIPALLPTTIVTAIAYGASHANPVTTTIVACTAFSLFTILSACHNGHDDDDDDDHRDNAVPMDNNNP